MRIQKLSVAVAAGLRTLAFRFRPSPRQSAEQVENRSMPWQTGQWIPLTAASQILYDELNGTIWRERADRETSVEGRLNYMAGCLVRNVPIEGRSPPSMTHHSIPSGDFDAGIIKGGGNYFQRYYESYLTFLDMRVRTEDLLDALEKMKTAETLDGATR